MAFHFSNQSLINHVQTRSWYKLVSFSMLHCMQGRILGGCRGALLSPHFESPESAPGIYALYQQLEGKSAKKTIIVTNLQITFAQNLAVLSSVLFSFQLNPTFVN